MAFLNEEKEKLSDWWDGISKRDLLEYLFGAAGLLFLIFLYYYSLGVTDLFEWYRTGRNMGECFVLLFLTQVVARRNLLHPFWRVGYVPFFLWNLIFPYVFIQGTHGPVEASFNDLSPYFLTAVGGFLFLFFMMNVISRVCVGRKLAVLIVLFAVLTFSFSALAFLGHYEFLGMIMTPREMFFAVTNTGLWFHRVILAHVGIVPVVLCTVLSAVYGAACWIWIYRSAYCLDSRWLRNDRKSYSCIHRILQFLLFFLCAWLLIRWASECFPLHDYEMVKRYREYFDFVQHTRF